MDSKQKFIKNRYWKRKNRPKNVTNSTKTATKKPNDKTPDQLDDESEEECPLKQYIPEGGWFPESDSSSESDPEYLESSTELFSHARFEKSISDSKCDKKKDIDDLISENLFIKRDNSDKSKIQLVLASQEELKINKESYSEINSDCVKESSEKKSNSVATVDCEEDDLEFLLSLKEPTHTCSVSMKANDANDRRYFAPNSNYKEQQPVKSIDLEKWLDSVLDD